MPVGGIVSIDDSSFPLGLEHREHVKNSRRCGSGGKQGSGIIAPLCHYTEFGLYQEGTRQPLND